MEEARACTKAVLSPCLCPITALHHTSKKETSKKQEDAHRQSRHLVSVQEGSDSWVPLSHKGALIKQLSCDCKRAEVDVFLLTALSFEGVDGLLEHLFVLCMASTWPSRKLAESAPPFLWSCKTCVFHKAYWHVVLHRSTNTYTYWCKYNCDLMWLYAVHAAKTLYMTACIEWTIHETHTLNLPFYKSCTGLLLCLWFGGWLAHN